MKISIRLPYAGYEELYGVWAHEEASINFRKDLTRALRCTMCYAAEEAETYLKKLGHEVTVSDEAADVIVTLTAEEAASEVFSIQCEEGSVAIHGQGRAGILYGVYEFLEAQGVRWYTPKEEYVPKNAAFVYPESKTYVYDMNCGRGYDFEGPQKESLQLYTWMARNRMNWSAVRMYSIPFQRKLCMNLKVGGHIFEEIINPHNLTPDGRTFLEAHPDWYGQREEPITYENALKAQFCMTNPELLEYLAEVLLHRLNNEWKEADMLDVWPFDTWGKSCMCENCRRTGNGTDRTFHLFSYLRTAIDKACAEGRLDRNVLMEFGYYEGTDTIDPPVNPIPDNLKTSGDYGNLAVILRCYAHHIDDRDCYYNKIYADCLENITPLGIPTFVREYYNVSKFEDLPLLFSHSMEHDFRYYYSIGVRGMVYMHLPMIEWGVRSLTQYLYVRWCRDVSLDRDQLAEEYFAHLYGDYAEQAKKAYALAERATTYASSWRSWGPDSLLSRLLPWDGYTAEEPLFRDNHLGDTAVQKGLDAAKDFAQAAEIFREVRALEESRLVPEASSRLIAVNPAQQSLMRKDNKLLLRVNEDIRGLIYGADCFRILALFLAYYDALYAKNQAEADAIWAEIYPLANHMNEYTFALRYECPKPELSCPDALTRAQVKELFYRALAARNRK